jgi:hypothetical protein
MVPSHLLVVLVVIAATHLLRKMKDFWLRRQELNLWIQSARKDRDAKVHGVLAMEDSSGDEVKLLTASETRNSIAAGLLDPKKNVIHLAKRCRKYGRAEDAVNGVTEELYDDVGIDHVLVIFELESVWIIKCAHIFSYLAGIRSGCCYGKTNRASRSNGSAATIRGTSLCQGLRRSQGHSIHRWICMSSESKRQGGLGHHESVKRSRGDPHLQRKCLSR